MGHVKKIALVLLLTFSCLLVTPPQQEAKAAIAIAIIIKEAIKRVIKAVDLMIQRLQNKTIWLQNAQRVLENKLSELKLTEIADWTDKHRKLFKEYYDELWKVKTALSTYQRIRQIMDKQIRIVKEFNRAWTLVRNDDHFTEKEIDYMYRVYKGILDDSIRNLDQLLLVINSFKTQMSDAQRLAILTQSAERIEQNLADLLEFNMNTFQLSISRARTQYEIDKVKKLYGL
ncbi:conjugal transfer protein TraI [Chryseolinea lacunae]|uniref:Conjugal transfer protein TraI n=1 Tax=Chryseolinea lacunae TaxID=2801331 RepID=A0ABS1L2T3_9BACT|nr:conjugal transfer protein TraI [Chryseolinea lacunae]MBL0744861.1 conjugal transfer protein TraI [Chryseolinea lacunae]